MQKLRARINPSVVNNALSVSSVIVHGSPSTEIFFGKTPFGRCARVLGDEAYSREAASVQRFFYLPERT